MPTLLTHIMATGQPYVVKYGLWAIALGLFSETFFFAGLFVPGYAILVAAGFLVAAKEMNFASVISVAWTFAFLGDMCSYGLGYWCGGYLLQRHRQFSFRLRHALEQEGPALLLLYHYAHPLRALLPCTAGYFNYPFRTWVTFDAAGLMLWVGIIMGIGYIAHLAVFSHGEIAALAVDTVATLVMIIVTSRLYRNYSLMLRRH